MLEKLIASRLITPPAIWGKLPAHADFVRSGMRHGESEGWQPWLAQHGGLVGASSTGAPPVAFVVPPGTLAFAPRRFVVGVITPSGDKVGRRHALIVYQLAHPRWVEHHFRQPLAPLDDWLFWLARAVARHTGTQGAADAAALERTVRALWLDHAPGLSALWLSGRSGVERPPERRVQAQAMLDKLAGRASADDPATQLRGVRFLPWTDWPQRLFKPRAQSAFWQQDAKGAFVNATDRMPELWIGSGAA